MGTLNPRQARFVAEYLVDLNATQAAIRAGFSEKTANPQAARLLANVSVRSAIDEAVQRRQERVEVRTDDILRELLRLAMVDIGEAFDEHGNLLPIKDIPPDVRRAISAVEVDELWEGRGEDRRQAGVTKKVKFWDKTKGLELLGKHLKLFTDKVEHSGSLTLEQLVADSFKKKD